MTAGAPRLVIRDQRIVVIYDPGGFRRIGATSRRDIKAAEARDRAGYLKTPEGDEVIGWEDIAAWPDDWLGVVGAGESPG